MIQGGPCSSLQQFTKKVFHENKSHSELVTSTKFCTKTGAFLTLCMLPLHNTFKKYCKFKIIINTDNFLKHKMHWTILYKNKEDIRLAHWAPWTFFMLHNKLCNTEFRLIRQIIRPCEELWLFYFPTQVGQPVHLCSLTFHKLTKLILPEYQINWVKNHQTINVCILSFQYQSLMN